MGPVSFFVLMTLLTGLVYPLVVTAVVQIAMPKQSNGSLLYQNNQIMGSELIAQKFTQDKYFWPRDKQDSASQLDPHITLDMARSQINRIAKARDMNPDEISRILSNTKYNYINVLLVNLQLDKDQHPKLIPPQSPSDY